MPTDVAPDRPSLHGFQELNHKIYGRVDDRHYSSWDILSNLERFIMRAIKGVRKGNNEKLRINLVISLSWLFALMNRFHIDLEDAVWQRFPMVCSYCGESPCACKSLKPATRLEILPDSANRPGSLSGFQEMLAKIYPAEGRTLEHAAIHLAEELGEVSEEIHSYEGTHDPKHFKNLELEAADLFSCIIGVANSAGLQMEREMGWFYRNGCHVCLKIPCQCDFRTSAEFQS